MLPIPAASTTLANMAVTSQPVFNEFIPAGYMEAGLMIGALLIVFLVYVFRNGIAHLFSGLSHHSTSKFSSSPTSKPKYRWIMKGGRTAGYEKFD